MSRILLVDNEPNAIEAVRFCLESASYHIITALDGWQAFEMASGRLPEVVTTDWKMPRVDGLRLCHMPWCPTPDWPTAPKAATPARHPVRFCLSAGKIEPKALYYVLQTRGMTGDEHVSPGESVAD